MKTLNFLYKNCDLFSAFVKQEKLLDEKNILFQIFSDVYEKSFIENLIKDIVSVVPHAKIIGCTTSGCISNGRRIIGKTLVIVSCFENTNIKTTVFSCKGKDGKKEAEKATFQIGELNTKAILVFNDSLLLNREHIIAGIERVFPSIAVAGETAVSKDLNSGGYVFNEKTVASYSCAMVSLSSDTLFATQYSCIDWVPIGRKYTVTNVKNNALLEIEGQPAQDMYEKHLGRSFSHLKRLGSLFPLVVEKNSRLSIHEIAYPKDDKSLMLYSPLEIGDRFQLGYLNKAKITENISGSIQKLGKNPIESVFLYSSSGRLGLLGSFAKSEISQFGKKTSVNGCFGWGEYGIQKGKLMPCNQSLVMLALSENSNTFLKGLENVYQGMSEEEQYEDALYSLLQQTDQELHKVRESLEEKIIEKTEMLSASYYLDPVTGTYNQVKLAAEMEAGAFTKLAYFSTPRLLDYANFYGQVFFTKIEQELKKIGFASYYFSPIGGEYFYMTKESFIVACPKTTDSAVFFKTCKAYQEALKHRTFYIENIPINISCVFGLADGVENIWEKAGLAMNYALDSNEEYIVYDEKLGLERSMEDNLTMVNTVRRAVEDGRIKAFFQPLYNLVHKKIDKYEALVRMELEDGSITSPGYFLDIAKRSGVYHEITNIMLDEVLKKINEVGYSFSINLTVSDINRLDTRTKILSVLETCKDPSRLIFEIVESEDIQKSKIAFPFIEKLKAFGSKIAIDDFGSGYSNLSSISEIGGAIIKLDGSLVRRVFTNRDSEILVREVVNFCHATNRIVVAEFVSSKELYDKMIELGVDYAQGYYIGKPSDVLRSAPLFYNENKY